ncbi:PAS domain-containing protein [Oxalobacteraceae bacterium]|nr:PAS domain-containing protein [Oxalobacteraceae bacterium]
MRRWRNVLARLHDLPLQRKLLLVSVATAFVAMLAALLALASYDVLVARPRLVQDLSGRMDLVSLNLDVDLNFNDRADARRTLEALRGTPDIQGACLFDTRHALFASYSRSSSARCVWPGASAGRSHRFHGASLIMLAPVQFEREVVGYLQLEYALPVLAKRVRQYGLVLAVVLLTLVVGSLLHVLSLGRLVTRPVLALSRVADRVTREQRYDLRAPVAAGDEVGRLAEAFNTMLGAIAARDTALRLSQSLLQNIAENSSAVIYIKDLEGRYVMVNQRFRQIVPAGAPDPVGRLDAELFPAEAVALMRANDQAVLASGVPFKYEESVPSGEGAARFYISEKFPLLDEHGNAWAVGGVSTDITERKRDEVELLRYRDSLEEQVSQRTVQMQDANRELAASLETLRLAQDELVRSEKLAALGSLVAGVAHELNTPIGNSLLAVSTLVDQTRAFRRACEDGIKRSTLQNFVQDIESGGDIVLRNLHRAIDLVASFKQVAVDRATSQYRQFALSDLLNEILLVLVPTFKKTGIRVRQEIPAGILMHSYPGPFGQVLINLINNGLTHAFEERSEGDICISARQLDEGWIEVCVADNGSGIAPENMRRIYDPFFTTKLGRGGSGLGLNIVYNIVYGLLGGRIEVSSALGSGTRFILTLPASSPDGSL